MVDSKLVKKRILSMEERSNEDDFCLKYLKYSQIFVLLNIFYAGLYINEEKYLSDLYVK